MNNSSKDRLIMVLGISLAVVCLVFMLLVGGVLFFIFRLPDDEMNAESEVYEFQEAREEDSFVQDIQNPQDQYIGVPLADALPSLANNEDQEDDVEPAQEEAGEEVVSASINIPESEKTDEMIFFATTTIDGRIVTESIFSDYDLTVVHVWGTFCGPCIEEMGEYAVLYEELPENVNLIGIQCHSV